MHYFIMCGISAVISKQGANSLKVLLDSLKQLQNRGYDSYGVSCIVNNKLKIHKKASLDTIGDSFQTFADELTNWSSIISIGHTRWATHGIISDKNAHPHISQSGEICLVHNGIIENYSKLKEFLITNGYSFYSETDTEVIVNLIDFNKRKSTIESAIAATVDMLEGTYGLAIQCIDTPTNIYLIKNGSPILIGENDNYLMACSESSGFLNQIRHYYALENDKLAVLSLEKGIISTIIGPKIKNSNVNNTLTSTPYEHWTIKEIMEQSDSLLRAYNNGARLMDNKINLGGLDFLKQHMYDIQNIIFLGCGTSLFACHIGRYYLKELECVNNIMCFDAADFELNDIPLTGKSLLIMCSQSGETKDLHRVFQLIKNKNNIITMGVINAIDSLIAREVNCGIYMNAGREVAVASTKSFTSSVLIFKLFSLWCVQQFKLKQGNNLSANIFQNIRNINHQVSFINREISSLIKPQHIELLNHENIFVLGKGTMEYISKEMALKLKEICYIHAEGYSGTALKHGPFALLMPKYPIILLINQENRSKMWNVYKEIETRGANILVISEITDLDIESEKCILVPENKELQEILYMVVLQHVCYKLSIARGINPDKPRNLAKVVTVE